MNTEKKVKIKVDMEPFEDGDVVEEHCDSFITPQETARLQPLHQREEHLTSSGGISARVLEMAFNVVLNYSWITTVGTVFLITLELICVATYIWSSEVEIKWVQYSEDEESEQTQPQFIDKYTHTHAATYVFLSVLNIWFTLTFLAWLMAGGLGNIRRRLFTFQSLVALCTSVPMNVVSIGATYNYSTWGSGYIPLYLRVWWLYYYSKLLMDLPHLGLRRVIPVQVLRDAFFLMAVFTTCCGTFQITESITAKHIEFFNVVYYMFVTFSTAGYGDIHSTSRYSMAVVMIAITFAVNLLPKLVDSLSGLILMNRRFAKYQTHRHTKHVVVMGRITRQIMADVLNECFAGRRILRPVNIVFMSPDGFDQASNALAKDPLLHRHITLVQGNPASKEDLERVRYDTADAVFAMMDRSQPAGRGDFEVIKAVWTMISASPELPVYALLRHAKNTRHVSHPNMTVLELEELRHALLGHSSLCPGIIPLIVNLIRIPQDDVTPHPTTWVREYRQGRTMNIMSALCPFVLIGVGFLPAMVIMKKRTNALMIGVATGGELFLNPKLYLLKADDEIIYISTKDVFTDLKMSVLDLFDRGQRITTSRGVRKKHSMDALENDPWAAALTRKDTVAECSSNTSGPWLDPQNCHTDGGEVDDVAETMNIDNVDTDPMGVYTFIDADFLAENDGLVLPHNGHVVILDMATSGIPPGLSDSEHIDVEEFEGKLLWDTLHAIKRADPKNEHPIVILSRDRPAKPFCSMWDTHGYPPITIVEGSGTVEDDVARLNLKACTSVLIRNNGRGHNEFNDTITAVAYQIVRRVIDTNRRPHAHYIPVVVDMESRARISTLPPTFADPDRRWEFNDEFTMTPKFIIGEAMAGSMLDTALIQSYYNKYIVETLKRLILGATPQDVLTPTGKATGTAAASSHLGMKRLDLLLDADTEMSEVFSEMASSGRVLVAVFRKITPEEGVPLDLIGYRYIVTNPNVMNTPVRRTDIVFYLN